jgi:DNA mismatch repair protein MutS
VESGSSIVFLHQIEPGPASRSYGVQVARLAGMPAPLVRQARSALEALERSASAGQAQVDLFAAPSTAASASLLAQAQEPSRVERALQAMEPDRLSPREALEALYQLKQLAQDEQADQDRAPAGDVGITRN